jgi:hypothetical protein
MSKNWDAPPYYWVWAGMKDRCVNPRSKAFADYGGRGIKVCERWKNSFQAFADDMGIRPEKHSLDRIDNDGDYTPENCRWSDRKTQQRNQRRAVYVMIEGARYRAIELAEKAGLKTDTVVERAAQGLSMAEVIDPNKRVSTVGLALGADAARAAKKASTHCKHGHERTPENVLYTKEGYRYCRQCHNAKMRARTAAKRAALICDG